MSLSIEWKRKIEYYLSDFPIYITTEAAKISYSDFITRERLTPGEAAKCPASLLPRDKNGAAPGNMHGCSARSPYRRNVRASRSCCPATTASASYG